MSAPQDKPDIFLTFIKSLDVSTTHLFEDSIATFSLISPLLLLLFFSFRVVTDLKDNNGYKDGIWALCVCTFILAAYSFFANTVFDVMHALDKFFVHGSMESFAKHIQDNMYKAEAIINDGLNEQIEKGSWWSSFTTMLGVSLTGIANVGLSVLYLLSKLFMFAVNVFMNLSQSTLLFVALIWSFFVIPCGVWKENAWAWAPLKIVMVLLTWKVVLYAMIFVLANAIDTGLEAVVAMDASQFTGLDRTSLLMVFVIVNILIGVSMIVAPFVAIYLVNKQAGAAPIVAGNSFMAGAVTYVGAKSLSLKNNMMGVNHGIDNSGGQSNISNGGYTQGKLNSVQPPKEN
jgi:hypothetical protein